MKIRLLNNPGGIMSTITAGFDLFETTGDAYFALPSGFSVPADFFHKSSAPFTGIIRFEGYPLRKFKDPRTGKEHKTGTTDTIVHRKQDVTIKSVGGSGTTEIELVQLSLRSCRPIEVHVGRGVQRWDVQVSVSRSKPSAGSMTITQTSEHGGQFASELVIWPLFRFERQSDGEERFLDVGALKIPAEKHALVARLNTLLASEVAWQDGPPVREDALAIPELTGRFAVATIGHHSHFISVALLQ
jgi:hypothetical protein